VIVRSPTACRGSRASPGARGESLENYDEAGCAESRDRQAHAGVEEGVTRLQAGPGEISV